MIQTKDLCFGYDGMPAYRFKDFSAPQGQTVFLHGPSGCGKTTFLHLISGVLRAQSGHIELLAQNIAGLSNAKRDHFRRDHMGYIFQQFNLVPYLSVQDNINLPLKLSTQKRQQQTSPVAPLIEQLQLQQVLHHKASRISQGQKQRVAIARATVGKPAIILADEPTSALDQANSEICMQILLEQCRDHNTTLFFVSHDLSLQSYFDRTLAIKDLLEVA